MTFTKYFVVRKYHNPIQPGGEWYDVRTKDEWLGMIHEEDTSVDQGVLDCCLWSATQQGAEQGPVWPIAYAFSTLEDAEREMRRSQKSEPACELCHYEYKIVDVSASLSV